MDFNSFEEYYCKSNRFTSQLSCMIQSYCINENLSDFASSVFWGFGIDQIKMMDVILMRNAKDKLNIPSEENAVYFLCGLWIISASDILVYNKYPQKIKQWHALTNYPKFTGWNYYATHPRILCDIILEKYDVSVREDLEQFMVCNKDILLNNIIDDVCVVLNLSKNTEYTAMYDCLYKLWFSKDEFGSYDHSCFVPECFRDSKEYFD